MALTDARTEGRKMQYFRWQFIADLRQVLARQFVGEQEDGDLSVDDVDDVETTLRQCFEKWSERATESMTALSAEGDHK